MKKSFLSFFVNLLLVASLLCLGFYTYVFFYVFPYYGFELSNDWSVYPPAWNIEPLREGDSLLKIGEMTFEEYKSNLLNAPFAGYHTGDQISLVVQRGSQELTILWKLSPPSSTEVIDRLAQFWFPYIFWLFGLLTALLLRPRDERWALLVAFNVLTGLWLMGGMLSSTKLAYSAIFYCMVIWLCLPLYLHLHWVFPRPLGRLPGWLVRGGYLAGVLLAVAQLFQWLPSSAYLAGFLLAVAGSIGLALAHLFGRSQARRDIALIVFAIVFSLAPSIITGILAAFGLQPGTAPGAFLPMIFLPGVYFYTAYRRQLGWLEAPVNRIVGLIFFLVLLFSIGMPLAVLVRTALPGGSAYLVADGILIFVVGLLAVRAYPGFQRWFERRILGIPLDAARLSDVYAERITTCLEVPSLKRLLQEEVAPSLLVRQSALLYAEKNSPLQVIYTDGVEAAQLPQSLTEPALLEGMGRQRLPAEAGADQPYPWVRLALPLRLGGQVVGLWLLGQHDPEDYYSQVEIDTLQNLAHQTSIALANILQTERLHALYQVNIENQEEERRSLARELHDDVLGQMALLAMSTHQKDAPASAPAGDPIGFDQAYQSATGHIRSIINSLRPATLNYGLRLALDELADELPEITGSNVEIHVDMPSSQLRYPPQVELHLFRIAQQACQNALQHAQASHVRISGRLEEGAIELKVEDNGQGMESSRAMDLAWLLANRHFGLAGMYERSALIGARLQFDSAPGSGTRVSVSWTAPSSQLNQ